MHLERNSPLQRSTAKNCQREVNARSPTCFLEVFTGTELVLNIPRAPSASLLLNLTFLVCTASFSQNTNREMLFFFPLSACEQIAPGMQQVWGHSLLLQGFKTVLNTGPVRLQALQERTSADIVPVFKSS